MLYAIPASPVDSLAALPPPILRGAKGAHACIALPLLVAETGNRIFVARQGPNGSALRLGSGLVERGRARFLTTVGGQRVAYPWGFGMHWRLAMNADRRQQQERSPQPLCCRTYCRAFGSAPALRTTRR